MQQFNVFSSRAELSQTISTKDLATEDIQRSLLNAEKLGQDQLIIFVKQRFLCTYGHISYLAPLVRMEALTIKGLIIYMIPKHQKGKETVVKADMSMM